MGRPKPTAEVIEVVRVPKTGPSPLELAIRRMAVDPIFPRGTPVTAAWACLITMTARMGWRADYEDVE
jgi:hypothetical protein